MASMQHIISAAEKVIGCNLSFLQCNRWAQMRAGMIEADPSHPKHSGPKPHASRIVSSLPKAWDPHQHKLLSSSVTPLYRVHTTWLTWLPFCTLQIFFILHTVNFVVNICQYLHKTSSFFQIIVILSTVYVCLFFRIFLHILLSINFYFLYYIYA